MSVQHPLFLTSSASHLRTYTCYFLEINHHDGAEVEGSGLVAEQIMPGAQGKAGHMKISKEPSVSFQEEMV